MAPLFPLEDNVNTTEECRYNLDLTLDSLFGLYNGNTIVNDALSISSLTLQPDHNLINSETNTPLVDLVSACKNYSIVNSPVYKQYPIYLYYTYCGYSRVGESVDPCIAYTSNTMFLNKLNIDKQFFDYINFNFTPFNINDLTAGIATYKFKISDAVGLNDKSNVFYNVFNPTNWTAPWCPGKDRAANYFFEENSYTPPPIDCSQVKTACRCISNTNKDLLTRFPYYPCSILYKQNSDDAILYSQMNPIREIFVTQNLATTDITKIANTDNLSSFSKLLVDSQYWKKDYITDNNTDIIVCTQVPEEGTPYIATYFDYISSALDIANTVSAGYDTVQPFKFDSRYFNNTSNNMYTKAKDNAQNWGNAGDYKKDMPYCQVSAKLTYRKDNESITRLAYIPPILSPARIKEAKDKRKNYTCRIYYTGAGNINSTFETLGCTPLARRQPVLIIDDIGIFEKEYSYSLNSTNRATNTNIATKLNNVAPLNIFRKYISNNTPNQITGEASQKSEIITLKPGKYQLTVIGGAGTGIYGFFNLNHDYWFYETYRGRNGSVCKCNIECKKDIKFKLITGSQGLWNAINIPPIIGVYNQYTYEGYQHDGADSKIQIINEDGTTTDFIICGGGCAAKFNNGVSVNISNVNINESIPNITVLEKIILYKDETNDIKSTYTMVSPDSVLYNSTPLYTYTSFNNNYGWAGALVWTPQTDRKDPTGGYISIEQYY